MLIAAERRDCNFTFARKFRKLRSAPSPLGVSEKKELHLTRFPPGNPRAKGPLAQREVLLMKSSRNINFRTAATHCGILSLFVLGFGGSVVAQTAPTAAAKNVVLVHGGFVDGSGWEGVYKILKKDGYHVAIVQNPTISLANDVAATKRIVHAQAGPVLLRGPSYGGGVITEAGNDPQVVGLVYIAAFAPDKGESVSTLLKDAQPGTPASSILPPQDGYLYQDKARFPASFGADVDEEK